MKFGFPVLVALVLIVSLGACTKGKARPLVPLALEPQAKAPAVALTEQGMQA